MAYLLAAFQNSTPLTRFRLSTSFFPIDVIDDIKYREHEDMEKLKELVNGLSV